MSFFKKKKIQNTAKNVTLLSVFFNNTWILICPKMNPILLVDQTSAIRLFCEIESVQLLRHCYHSPVFTAKKLVHFVLKFSSMNVSIILKTIIMFS